MTIIIFLIGIIATLVIPGIIGHFFPIKKIRIIDGWMWIIVSSMIIFVVLIIILLTAWGIYETGFYIYNLFI